MFEFVKRHKNKIIFSLGLFLLLVVLIIIYLNLKNNQKCVAFNCLVFPGKNLWQVKDTYQNDNLVWRGLVSYKDYSVRLYRQSNVSSKEADDFTKVTTMKITLKILLP